VLKLTVGVVETRKILGTRFQVVVDGFDRVVARLIEVENR